MIADSSRKARRMFKKAVQQHPQSRVPGKREDEAYAGGYVEASSDARTPLADFFNILLAARPRGDVNATLLDRHLA